MFIRKLITLLLNFFVTDTKHSLMTFNLYIDIIISVEHCLKTQHADLKIFAGGSSTGTLVFVFLFLSGLCNSCFIFCKMSLLPQNLSKHGISMPP